jgi:predicted transcriptional regulator
MKKLIKLLKAILMNIAIDIVDLLGKIQRNILPPQTVLLNYAVGYIVVNRSIYAVAKFGIADLLKDGPKSIEYLAEKTNANIDSLLRIMRTLTSEGIFKEKKNNHFATNKFGKQLQSDIEDSMSTFIKATGSDWSSDVWFDLLENSDISEDNLK